MRKVLPWTLAILSLGNLALWGGHFTDHQERSFDFEGFRAAVRSAARESDLREYRFLEEEQLPEHYLYLESGEPDAALLSVYVGYYPRQGLLEGTPHDPVLCYESFGWEVEEDPASLVLGPPSRPVVVQRLLVRRQGLRRVVLYWLQHGGLAVGESHGDGLLDWILDRSLHRSDRAWIRVELDPSRGTPPLDPELQERLLATMAAAARALR